MKGDERRLHILEVLEREHAPVTATVLAAELGVSRQIIVSDIALMRAHGTGIIAERRGYYLDSKSGKGRRHSLVCRHNTEEETRNELYAMVDFGCRVIDVIVEHPVYGQITVDLGFASRFDVDEYLQRQKDNNAAQLSSLTDGLHVHTVLVPSEDIFKRLCERLRASGVLVECAED